MKKIIVMVISFIVFSSLWGQEITNDIIEIRHKKKSVAKAMIMSSLFPGAGQFYANKKSITTYISPIIEIGLIYGYIHYTKEGDNITDDYEDFADEHYDRQNQYDAEIDFMNQDFSINYQNYFRLDEDNTQHFYEDIGKYPKYVFGWNDWFAIYGANGFNWIGDMTWSGNMPTDSTAADYLDNRETYDSANGKYSSLRAEYIDMRMAAEEEYDKAELFSFGLVLNHIVAAIDAVRLTRSYNLESLSASNNIEVKFSPVLVNNQISPGIFITKRF